MNGFPLPCPCCGSKAFYIEGNSGADQVDLVQCLECDLELMGTRDRGSALEAWNRRTHEDSLPTSSVITMQDRYSVKLTALEKLLKEARALQGKKWPQELIDKADDALK